MEPVSFYVYAHAAQTQMQMEMLSLRQAAEGQRQMADLLMQQTRTVQPVGPAPSANPEHLGQNVDTYA